MAATLKKLADQVIVITGASSGIGLATAENAAAKGARVVLAARSEKTLNEIADRICSEGGEAVAVGCNVADRAQVEYVARVAIDHFGRIDTWVNNAGLGLYGRLDEIEDEDARRLFDINFWGVVYGSQAALPHLRKNGGALINVGSEVSDAFAPLLGIYTASKHAVKGYTDTLRVEIENIDKAPVSITLIQPTAVDTPFPQHARNFTGKEPKLPSPMIDPQDVADAILEAAENPVRERKVGGMAVLNTLASKFVPSLADRQSAKKIDELHTEEPARNPDGALHRASETVSAAGKRHGAGHAEG